MNSAKASGARIFGRVTSLGGMLCFILLGPAGCAPDETISPADPTAALAEMSDTKGWWHWSQTLSIDPDSTTISESGDTVRLFAILSSAWKRNEAPALVDADWFVLDPEFVAVEGSTNSTRSVLLRGLQPGMARIVAIYDGLAAIARVSVGEGGEPGDTVPVAAVVSEQQPVLLVGDTVTVRPNLIDEDSVMIPTEPSEWSTGFDSALVSVSEDFLVTALAPTPPGSTSVVTLTHTETELQAEVGIVILPDQGPGEWPDNEPPGMTRILAADGSSKEWPAGFVQFNGWRDDNRVAVVSDPDSKHGQAVEKRFFVGDESGWHGLASSSNFGAFEELYIRIVFRLSPNWQWHRVGGKYLYYGIAERDRFVAPIQYTIGWHSDGTPTWTPSGDGSRHVANGIPPTTRDVYHTIEVHHVASTSGSNGSLRMWVDGDEVQSFRSLANPSNTNVVFENVEWGATRDKADKRLSGMQAFMFWGGQDDTKRVDDWIRLSELYVSGRN